MSCVCHPSCHGQTVMKTMMRCYSIPVGRRQSICCHKNATPDRHATATPSCHRHVSVSRSIIPHQRSARNLTLLRADPPLVHHMRQPPTEPIRLPWYAHPVYYIHKQVSQTTSAQRLTRTFTLSLCSMPSLFVRLSPPSLGSHFDAAITAGDDLIITRRVSTAWFCDADG